MIDIAPEVPGKTAFKDVIILGCFLENIPSSVPHVSAVAAATAAQ